MMSVFKEKSGSELIANSIQGFTKVVDELETGIAMCAKEEESINEEISRLNENLVKAQESKSQAKTIQSNIKKMLTIK